MMRVAALGALFFASGVMLLGGSDARSGSPPAPGVSIDHQLARLLLKVGDKKTQKQLNKACGPGKVFVEGRCVKRENAEKREEKAKQKEAQKPAPPPPKQHCEIFKAGTGGALGCAGGPTTCNKLANGDTQCCCPE